MRTLLVVMGIVETGAGLALLVAPSFVAELLLGSSLDGAVPLIVARICGAGLLSLGIACLLTRDEAGASAATAVLVAMLVYNTTATALFVYSFVGLGFKGIILWPAIVIHGVLALWCAVCLRRSLPVTAPRTRTAFSNALMRPLARRSRRRHKNALI